MATLIDESYHLFEDKLNFNFPAQKTVSLVNMEQEFLQKESFAIRQFLELIVD